MTEKDDQQDIGGHVKDVCDASKKERGGVPSVG